MVPSKKAADSRGGEEWFLDQGLKYWVDLGLPMFDTKIETLTNENSIEMYRFEFFGDMGVKSAR